MAIFIPPKGSAEVLSSIPLQEGEIVFNTTDKKFYTGDNGKLGGKAIFTDGAPALEGDFATKSDLSTLSTTFAAQIAEAVKQEADPLFTEALSGLATKEDLEQHEANAEAAYLKAADFDTAFADAFGDAAGDYYTKDAANDAIARATSGLASKSEIASLISDEQDPDFHEALSGLARVEDLDNYASKSEVDSKIYKNDYTSFEVTVISAAIPAGTLSDIDNPFGANEKIAYKYGVGATYAQMLEKFYLCSDTPIIYSDVVIDWGDGTQTAIADDDEDVTLKKGKPGDSYNKIEVKHTYAETGKYIVKIYGKDYFGIRNTDNDYNLISRVFEEDLSLASCVTDLTDFCNRARLLLKVDAARWINTKNVTVAYELFAGCHNLYSAVGFYGFFPKLLRYNMMFSHCWSLVYTDIRIMPGTYAIHSMFNGCHLLGSLPSKPVKVEDLFCENTSFNARCAAAAAFRNCYSLSLNDVSKVADLLWDNVNTVFATGTSATRTFYCDNGVPAELTQYAPSLTAEFNPPAWLSAVPTTWGGSKTDDTITVNKEFFNSILTRLSQLEADVADISGAVSGANREEEP